MAELQGTRVLAPIVPPDDSKTFPTHIANFGKGNIHSFITTAERDAIPAERREVGMLCFVSGVNKTFQLKNGITNSDWVEFTTASSGGTGGGSGDMTQMVYDTDGDGIVDRAEIANAVDWSNITNKPGSFSVGSHTHSPDEISTTTAKNFVSDVERNYWNTKQDQIGYTPENIANKNKVNGYAGIGTDGKIPVSLLPDLANQNVYIVTDIAARDSIAGMKTGDIAYDRTVGDSYIYDGTTWLIMVDKNWASISVDWSSITNKPNSSTVAIDDAVNIKHTHSNKAILDATTDVFTTALKNAIGDALKIKGVNVDDTNKIDGYVMTFEGGKYVLKQLNIPTSSGDMQKLTYDANNDGVVDRASVADAVAWANITSKPATYVPTAHKNTHFTGGSDEITPADIGAASAYNLNLHVNNKANPHAVTKAQVGLGNVDDVKQLAYAEKGSANGVAPLGADGKVPTSYLPAIGGGNAAFSAASESQMLALTATNGDKCIRTDEGKTYVLTGTDPAIITSWTEDQTSAPVTSVNGFTGHVTLSTTNVSEGSNLYFTDARVLGVAGVTTAVNHAGRTDNPHNVTKAQIGLTNVTNDAQVKRTEMGAINGVATLGTDGKVPAAQLPNMISGVSSVNGKTGDVSISTADILEAPGSLYYTDARVDARISSNATISGLSTHTTRVDNPHAVTKAQVGLSNVDNVQQIPMTQKAAANGVATLDATGKIPSSQLPALAVTDTFVVASSAAMLALAANTGDIAVRTDINKTYILKAEPATNASNWQEMLTPTGAVSSVNGLTGNVSLSSTNIAEGTNLYYTDTRVKAVAEVANAYAHISRTDNPHNVTKTQIGLSNVTNDAQVKRTEMGAINGVATLGADGKVPASQLPAGTGGSGGGGSTITRYEASGTTGGKVWVTATGTGVAATLVGNTVTFSAAAAGVEVLSARIHLAPTDHSGSATINLPANGGYGVNSDIATNAYLPTINVITDGAADAYKLSGWAATVTNNGQTISINGLTTGSGAWINLQF